MRTWEDYKKYAKGIDPEAKKDLEEVEVVADIISAMITQRNAMGLSQRDLASICGMPQSSVARIESLKTTPNLDTLLRLMRPLGLELKVSLAEH